MTQQYFKKRTAPLRHSSTRRSVGIGVMALLFSAVLMACAGISTTSTSVSQTPTLIPLGTATQVSPSPIRIATVRPTPTPFPTPQHGSLLLDVQPTSKSLVGKMDCPDIVQIFTCHIQVEANAKNSGPLPWAAFTTIPGAPITFTPSSGTLAPGKSVQVTIFVPDHDCTQGDFSFQGPSNTQTLSWTCS